MRRTLGLILLFSVCFFIPGCKKENNSCFKSTGKRSTEIREFQPTDIHTIILDDNIDLIIHQDSNMTATIDAGENLIDFIKTEVNDGVLKITNDNKCNFLRSFKKQIRVYLTINEFDSIMSYGSGDITIPETFNTFEFKVNLFETTGDIDLNVNCARRCVINAHQSASNMTLKGFVRSTVLYNSGAGWVHAKDLKSVFLQVNSKSTGDCIVGDSREMFIQLESSGNIIYYGSPELIQIWDYTGDGELIKGS